MAGRHDYAHPFRIAAAGQAAQAAYEEHVDQMVRQVLLTSPGERVNLPEFGCPLRRLVFAPHDPSLDATTQLLVQQALARWLGAVIEVKQVRVAPPEETGDEAQLVVVVEYVVKETLDSRASRVVVR
ncbi:MAG TPA: GPW/gp25 family protein [Acidimicrobiales bacterium]|nr:GPW/gp25 family protein [Acidimicrobiales bacterium]